MRKTYSLAGAVGNPTVRGVVASSAVAVAMATAILISCIAAIGVEAAHPVDATPPISTGLARIEGGVKLGIGMTQHQGVEDPRLPYSVDSGWRRGLAASAFVRFPVTSRFSLQQEVGYFHKGSRQIIALEILEIPTALEVDYDFSYLEVPFLLRYVWLHSGPPGRRADIYSMSGFSFGLKLDSRYRLNGVLIDEESGELLQLSADAPMDEVDIFDFAFVYGTGIELRMPGGHFLLEYRFALSLERLDLPTYAYVPAWDGSEILIENDPVPLRNQAHAIMVGFCF